MRDIPGNITFVVTAKERRGQIDTFSFEPVHDPDWDNYAHTEVRAYRNREPHHLKSPKTVRLQFRAALREKMRPA